MTPEQYELLKKVRERDCTHKDHDPAFMRGSENDWRFLKESFFIEPGRSMSVSMSVITFLGRVVLAAYVEEK